MKREEIVSNNNIISSTNDDINSIFEEFGNSIVKDSKPLQQNIEEYINEEFWNIV